MGRMQNLVPTTPGSVFGGSRNVMRQSQQNANMESQVIDDDLDSSHNLTVGGGGNATEYRANSNSMLRGGSSNKSGDSNVNVNGTINTINNIRGSFGLDSALS